MNKARYILAVSLLLCGLAASAQRVPDRDPAVLTYDRVIGNNLWNGSRNITGIRQDTVSRSYAELSGNYVSGGFRDTWEAARSWEAGAMTASIRHMERISLKGSFSFRQTEGYDMCGSMFLNPGFYPVDVLEFTPGRKTRQTYSFDGGIAYDISDTWRIGAAMDFESANMAKRKDLRHTNWWLDMTVAPSFMFHKGDFSAGASYIMRKTSESIKAEQIGIAESSYYAFLDKGLMYGEYSVWSGSGLHLSEAGVNGFPVRDISHGAAVQLQYKGLFAEVEYLNRRGVIGEKALEAPTWWGSVRVQGEAGGVLGTLAFLPAGIGCLPKGAEAARRTPGSGSGLLCPPPWPPLLPQGLCTCCALPGALSLGPGLSLPPCPLVGSTSAGLLGRLAPSVLSAPSPPLLSAGQEAAGGLVRLCCPWDPE